MYLKGRTAKYIEDIFNSISNSRSWRGILLLICLSVIQPVSSTLEAASMDRWLRSLIFGALNRSSSQCCSFESSSSHM